MTVRVAAAAAGFILLWAGSLFAAQGEQPDPKELDKQAKDRISEFKKGMRKAKTEPEVIAQIRTLAGMKHERILKELTSLLRSFIEESVLDVLFDEISKYADDPTAASTLLSYLDGYSRRAIRNKDGVNEGHEMAVRILEGLIAVKRLDSSPKITSLFAHMNLELAKAAVRAVGEIGNVEQAQDLIRLLADLESVEAQSQAPPGGIPGGPPGGLPGVPGGTPPVPPGYENQMYQEQWRRKNHLEPVTRAALEKLTGHREKDSQSWLKWWSQNGRDLMKKQHEEEAAKKKSR